MWWGIHWLKKWFIEKKILILSIIDVFCEEYSNIKKLYP